MNSDAPIIKQALCEAFKVEPQLTLTDAHWLKARLADTCPPSPSLSVVLAAAELGIPQRLSANRRNSEFAASQAVMCLERERAIQADAARRAVAIWAAALNVPLTQQVKSRRPRTSLSASVPPLHGPLCQPAKSNSSSALAAVLPSQQTIVPRPKRRLHRFQRLLLKCALLCIVSYIVFVVIVSLKNSNRTRARETATSSDVLTQPKTAPPATRRKGSAESPKEPTKKPPGVSSHPSTLDRQVPQRPSLPAAKHAAGADVLPPRSQHEPPSPPSVAGSASKSDEVQISRLAKTIAKFDARYLDPNTETSVDDEQARDDWRQVRRMYPPDQWSPQDLAREWENIVWNPEAVIPPSKHKQKETTREPAKAPPAEVPPEDLFGPTDDDDDIFDPFS